MEPVVRDKLNQCIHRPKDKRKLSKFLEKGGICHRKHGGKCLGNDECPNWREQRECPPQCPDKKCGNREIYNGLVTDHLVTVTRKGKGLTLNTTKPIKKDTKVIEYCGVLRKHEDYRRDLDRNPNRNSYGLEVVDDWIIDATSYSSMARYISHSCEPNLRVEFWISDDRFPRAILVANCDIKEKEELSFDYEFVAFEGHSHWVCNCGKFNCRYKANNIRTNKKRKRGPKVFTCEVCDRVFNKLFNLKRHKEDMHLRRDGNFVCTICQKSFARKDRLTRHSKTHGDRAKRFWCKTCGKRFLTRQGKLRHGIIHEENRVELTCDKFKNGFKICNKKFLSALGLRKHQAVHHA